MRTSRLSEASAESSTRYRMSPRPDPVKLAVLPFDGRRPLGADQPAHRQGRPRYACSAIRRAPDQAHRGPQAHHRQRSLRQRFQARGSAVPGFCPEPPRPCRAQAHRYQGRSGGAGRGGRLHRRRSQRGGGRHPHAAATRDVRLDESPGAHAARGGPGAPRGRAGRGRGGGEPRRGGGRCRRRDGGLRAAAGGGGRGGGAPARRAAALPRHQDQSRREPQGRVRRGGRGLQEGGRGGGHAHVQPARAAGVHGAARLQRGVGREDAANGHVRRHPDPAHDAESDRRAPQAHARPDPPHDRAGGRRLRSQGAGVPGGHHRAAAGAPAQAAGQVGGDAERRSPGHRAWTRRAHSPAARRRQGRPYPGPRRQDHRQCGLLPLPRRVPPARALRPDDHRVL